MVLFGVSLIITLFGLLNLFGINSSLFYKQLFSTFIGILLYFFVKRIKKIFLLFINHIYILLLFINVYLLFFGESIKGAKRWIVFFNFSFQPSELFIIIFIFFIAKIFSDKYIEVFSFWKWLQSLFFLGISFFLIYLQPDLGTALEFFLVYLIILSFSRIDKKYFYYIIFSFIILMPFFWLFLKPYQKERIISFIKRNYSFEKASYNMRQAEISIGSGGLLGQGLGKATQVRLKFLPEMHTDFAFSAFIAQTGFLGGGILLFLYGLLIFFLLHNFFLNLIFGNNSSKTFVFLAKLGFASHIFYRVFVNVGMNLGIMPIAGVPLVLFSYGGSSIISYFLGLALLTEDNN